jgi:hypothetical protein
MRVPFNLGKTRGSGDHGGSSAGDVGAVTGR